MPRYEIPLEALFIAESYEADIKKLEAENRRLREALEKINSILDVARQALAPREDDNGP